MLGEREREREREREKEREREREGGKENKGCLNCVGSYLHGTVLQRCRLYKRCWNLPARHCVTVMQAV